NEQPVSLETNLSTVVQKDSSLEIKLVSKDFYGNSTETIKTLELNKPSLSLAFDKPGFSFSTNQNQYTFNVQISETSRATTKVFYQNTEIYQTSENVFSLTLPLNEPENLFRFEVTDNHQNALNQDVTVSIDNTGPQLLSLIPGDGEELIGTTNLKIIGSSNESLSEVLINGESANLTSENSFEYELNNVPNGEFNYQLKLVDLVGNEGVFNRTANVKFIVLNQALVSIEPTANGDKLRVFGTPMAARPNVEVEIKAGFFSLPKTVITNSDGSFSEVFDFFETVEFRSYDSELGLFEFFELDFQRDTTLSGVVLDINDNPLQGVSVSISGTNQSTTTNAMGTFVINDPVSGNHQLVIDANNLSNEAKKFSKVAYSINISPFNLNVIENPVYLVPIVFDGTQVELASGQGATITHPSAPGVSLNISPDSAVFPNGNSSGAISLSKIPSNKTTLPLPNFIEAESVYAFEPSGLNFTSPAQLTLPNDNELPSGTNFIILSKNSETGTWELDGVAEVSEDGSSVVTKEGMGITHFSEVIALPSGPDISSIDEGRIPGADLTNNFYSTQVRMPTYKSLGQDIGPSLTYRSDWANPTAIVSNNFSIPRRTYTRRVVTSGETPYYTYEVEDTLEGNIIPQAISAQFSTENLIGKKIKYNNIPNEVTLSYGMDLASLSSGFHTYNSSYEIELKNLVIRTRNLSAETNDGFRFLDGNNTLSTNVFTQQELYNLLIPSEISGPLYVQNKINSEFGRGWKLDGVSKILNPNDPRIVVENEDGSISNFVQSGFKAELVSNVINGATNFSSKNYPEIIYTRYSPNSRFNNIDKQWEITVNENWTEGDSIRFLAATPTYTGLQENSYFADILKFNANDNNLSESTNGHESIGTSRYNPSATWSNLPAVGLIYDFINIASVKRFTTYANQENIQYSCRVESHGLIKHYTSILPKPDGGVLFLDRAGELVEFDGENRSRIIGKSRQSNLPGIEVDNPNLAPFTNLTFLRTDFVWNETFNAPVSGNESFYDPIPFSDTGYVYTAFDQDIIDDYYFQTNRHSALMSLRPGEGYRPLAQIGRSNVVTFPAPTSKENLYSCIPEAFYPNDLRPVSSGNSLGAFNEAQFNNAAFMAYDRSGNGIFIVDKGNNQIKHADFTSNVVSLVAGSGSRHFINDDRLAIENGLSQPLSVAEGDGGEIFISTSDGYIKKVKSNGIMVSYAGKSLEDGGSLDNLTTIQEINFVTPQSILFDDLSKILYVADSSRNKIFAIDTTTDRVSLLAGASGNCDGSSPISGAAPTDVCFQQLTQIDFDDNRNVIALDKGRGALIRFGAFVRSNESITFDSLARDGSTLTRNEGQSFTLEYRNGVKKTFLANGLHLNTIDRNGRTVTYSYDDSDRVISMTDPVGSITNYGYENGRLKTISDPAGRTTQFDFVGNELRKVIYPDGTERKFTYDNNGLLLTSEDQVGAVSQIVYNIHNRVEKIIDPLGFEKVYDDSKSKLLDAQVSNNGEVIEVTPTGLENGQANDKVIDPNGNVMTYLRDRYGKTIEVKNAKGEITRTVRDTKGRPIEITYPDGSKSTYTYNEFDEVLTTFDSRTNTTTSRVYDEFGNITEFTNERGVIFTYTYNEDGLLISLTSSEGNVFNYFYESNFSLLREAQNVSQDQKIFMDYDQFGNPSKITDSLEGEVNYLRDFAGNILEKTNQNGNTTIISYDLFNRPLSETTPEGNSVSMEYSNRGEVLKITDINGR
ncbi:MAG: carboxypeptidase regulatory-like domain-containing protein, partial [Halobacteriovoraceae bacterium]|nr:carboxypeptidase regulatory-like domain-containing protein [Halobacteriovoraceae bacterium]